MKLLQVSASPVQQLRITGKLRASKIGGVHSYSREDIQRGCKVNFKETMVEKDVLHNFFGAIREDPRIGTSHISVFMALYMIWRQNSGAFSFLATRREVMTVAKISGLATYHKCIRELHSYGYITYRPSFHPGVGSWVSFPL
jgi:hypothetical protein